MARIAVLGPAAAIVMVAAPAAAAQDGDLERAEALVRAGRLRDAAPLVRARLAQAPEDARAQALLGRILLSVGDPNAEALDLLERAVTAGRNDVPTLLALGHARFAAAGVQRDPAMKRILQVGAKEAFGAAAAAARAALEENPQDRLARKALADALRFQGDLVGAAKTAARLLLSLQATADAALANDVAAGLRDAVMRLPDAERIGPGLAVVRATLAADAERAAEARHRAVAHLYIEVLQRAGDWTAIAADGPALLERFPGDRVMPYTVAAALQHQAVDLDLVPATALRLQAARIYIAWIKADRDAGVQVTLGHQGFRGSFTLATALIDRGKGVEGRLIFDELWAVLPPGHARGWVTVSRAVEAKEAGNAATAIGLYTLAVTTDHPEPASAPQAADLAFLARAWSDLGLVHMGAAHQAGITTPQGTTAAGLARQAFAKAIRYADRAVGMQPAQAHDGHTFAVYARVNLARLEDRAGRRAEAIALVRAGLRAAAKHPTPSSRLNGTLTLRELLARWR
ncbi:MAG: hypothetical protein ACYTGX_06035 [Planctomycetota bacterium]|jgi:tetratricopeptide (TPR) repeat protein